MSKQARQTVEKLSEEGLVYPGTEEEIEKAIDRGGVSVVDAAGVAASYLKHKIETEKREKVEAAEAAKAETEADTVATRPVTQRQLDWEQTELAFNPDAPAIIEKGGRYTIGRGCLWCGVNRGYPAYGRQRIGVRVRPGRTGRVGVRGYLCNDCAVWRHRFEENENYALHSIDALAVSRRLWNTGHLGNEIEDEHGRFKEGQFVRGWSTFTWASRTVLAYLEDPEAAAALEPNSEPFGHLDSPPAQAGDAPES